MEDPKKKLINMSENENMFDASTSTVVPVQQSCLVNSFCCALKNYYWYLTSVHKLFCSYSVTKIFLGEESKKNYWPG